MDLITYYLAKYYIRILAFVFIFFSIVIAFSFLPFRYDIISDNQAFNQLLAYIFNFFIVAMPLLIIEHFTGGQFLKSYGLSNLHNIAKYNFLSLMTVIVPFSIVLIANYLLGNFSTKFDSFQVNFTLIVNILVIFIIALQEELIFRGFLINSLELRFSTATSVLLSSVIFASLHIFNTNFTYISAINTFLAGLLLGLLYVKSSTLWLPVFFHFFWNFLQPVMLNSPISGINFDIKIFDINQTEYLNILNGGAYGFENTIAATIVLILCILYFAKIETLNPYNSSYKFKMKYRLDSFLMKYENK